MYVYTELGEKLSKEFGFVRKAGEPAMIGFKKAEDRPGIAKEWEKAGYIEWKEEEK